MIKRIALVLAITLLVLINGCVPTDRAKSLPDDEFHVGTQGVVMEFMQDSPPLRVYENDPLDIMIEYSNKGAYDITGGRIYLSGFDTAFISPTPLYIPNFEAEGKNVFNPDGRITQTETFTDNSVRLPNEVDKITQTILATACYNYKTNAAVGVCINPKTKSLRNDICEVGPVSLSGGQGAPVAIARIEEEIYQNKLQFRIYFENAGDGKVMRYGATNNCHTGLQRKDADKVTVRSVSFSGRTMRCEPQNPIQLDDSGKGFVFCYYQGDLGEEAYNTLLQVELEYAYRSSIQRNVDIIKAP